MDGKGLDFANMRPDDFHSGPRDDKALMIEEDERNEYWRLVAELAVVDPETYVNQPLEVGRLVLFPHATDMNEMGGILDTLGAYFAEDQGCPSILLTDRQMLASMARAVSTVRSRMCDISCLSGGTVQEDPRQRLGPMVGRIKERLLRLSNSKKTTIGIVVQADLIVPLLCLLWNFSLPQPPLPLLTPVILPNDPPPCPHCGG